MTGDREPLDLDVASWTLSTARRELDAHPIEQRDGALGVAVTTGWDLIAEVKQLREVNERLSEGVKSFIRAVDTACAERDAMREQIAREDPTAQRIAAFSRWLESTPAYADVTAESVVWRRIGKVGEEYGEVVEAWLGALGENPRKGVTGCADDVVRELLDVATTALGAVEHFTGFDGSAMSMLADHVEYVCERAGVQS